MQSDRLRNWGGIFDLVHEPERTFTQIAATNIAKHLLKTAPADEFSSQLKCGTKISQEGMPSSFPLLSALVFKLSRSTDSNLVFICRDELP